MKLNRSKLRVEELERRENPSATNIGFGSDAVVFDVAGYRLHQNNANFATTSSAFGFSDAAMLAAQAVSTANGGTVNATLTDAFDGVLSWGLAKANGDVAVGPTARPLTYYDTDGIVDIVGTPIASKRYGPGAILTGDPASASFTGDSFGGLQLWQQNAVFSVNGTPVIRSIFFVRNATGTTITQNLGVFNNLGSNEFNGPDNTTLFASSSGDAVFTPGVDTWVGSFENYGSGVNPANQSGDPRLLFQLQGAFGQVRQGLDSSSVFVNADDNPHFNFNATLDAGETKAFLTFTGLYASKQAALNNNTAFASLSALRSSGLLAGLSGQTLGQIQNWDLAPVPTGEVVGTLAGPLATIRSFDADGNLQFGVDPFGGFTGGVSLARGDVNGDGITDIITGAGPGAGPHVKAFSGTDGIEIASFFAFDGGFDGGLSVASGDIDNDGFDDYVVGTLNGSSHVKVFSGATGAELASFFVFEGYTGGVNVASADVDGDGIDDLVVATRTGGSHVKVFSGLDGSLLQSYIAFDSGYTGGISIAAGDLNGDGRAEIVVGALQGVSHVKSFSGLDGTELASFFAYEGSLGGVSVAVLDADGDGIADIGTGSRVGSHVKAFDGLGATTIDSFLVDFGTGIEIA